MRQFVTKKYKDKTDAYTTHNFLKAATK